MQLNPPVFATFAVFVRFQFTVAVLLFVCRSAGIPNPELSASVYPAIQNRIVRTLGRCSPPKKIKSFVTSGWYAAQ